MKHILIAAIAATIIAPSAQAIEYCNCLPVPIEDQEIYPIAGGNDGTTSIGRPINIGTPVGEGIPAAGSSCGAENYQHLVGHPAIIADQLGAAGVARVLRPGDVVTMIYIAERMNITISEVETIDRVYCG